MAKRKKLVKRGNELLSVKEFAQFAGIEQSTLRYWDDIGIFQPYKRNEENNYRCYLPNQITAVKFINVLSDLNIPLKTIGELGRTRTPDTILDLLEEQESRLDLEMRRLRESYSVIHTFRGFIREGLRADTGKITLQELPEMRYIKGEKNDFGDDLFFYETFVRFCHSAKHLRINLNYPVGGQYDSLEAYIESPWKPTYFISIDPTGYDHRPEGLYMTGFTRGYYGVMSDLPQRMKAYAEEHNMECRGPLFVNYLHDEICQRDPQQYLSRACVEVRKKKKSKKTDEAWQTI